jgi:hypothetical protein
LLLLLLLLSAGWHTDEFLRRLGMEYFKLCLGEYGKALRVLGSNLTEFFSNLDGLHEQIKSSPKFLGQSPPSFRCEVQKGGGGGGDKLVRGGGGSGFDGHRELPPQPQGCSKRLDVHYYSFRRAILAFVGGTIEAVASMLFNVSVDMTVSPNRDTTSPHHMFFITTTAGSGRACNLCTDRGSASHDPRASKLSVKTFCASFPFHVIFDRNMNVRQLGTALVKMVRGPSGGASAATSAAGDGGRGGGPGGGGKGGGVQLSNIFEVVRPPVKISFAAFLSRLNSSFILRTKAMATAGGSRTNGRQYSPQVRIQMCR